jgi:squalene-hopene/tetraprenyl-beta-curcumene cyclase
MQKYGRWLGMLGLVVLLVVGGCQEATPTSNDTGDSDTPAEVVAQESALAILEATPMDDSFEVNASLDAEHAAKARELIDGAMNYLIANRDTDGAWSMNYEGQQLYQSAMTGMVLRGVLADPRLNVNTPEVKDALAVMLSHQREEDGGIYERDKGNYSTSLAVMALAMAAKEDAGYQPALDRAVGYLRGQVITPGSKTPLGEEITEDHVYGGGVSYGSHERPDLSNVSMNMEALHEAGVDGDDPSMQAMLAFVTRMQNLSETNTLAVAAEGPNDGGSFYAVAVRDGIIEAVSKAGDAENGGLRSYGSMTYAGFKSMLYANVDKDDPRVRGAYNWIRRYWTLDSNPNMPHVQSQQGLYYYYHVFAKALRANGEEEIVDVDGNGHNWREELIDALSERVNEDGSWVGDPRWFEGDPVLVTGYVLNALRETTAP